MNSVGKKTAQILWGEDRNEELGSTVVQDKTWAMVFESRYCDVDFRFVTGNREAFLSGEPENGGKKPSQLMLRKKYK